jgi:hypothetical protein
VHFAASGDARDVSITARDQVDAASADAKHVPERIRASSNIILAVQWSK